MTLKQKNEIALYSEKHTKASIADIKSVFDARYNLNIGKTTIGRILKNKESIKSQLLKTTNPDSKQNSIGKYDDVENALKLWIDVQESRNNPISDDILISKADDFAKVLNIENFKLSKGTLNRFKHRKGLKSYKVTGEMAEVDLNTLENSLEGLKIVLKEYTRKDIFNMDETGLYYRMMPSKSISSGPIKGFKKLLARITLAFTVSSEGEKLPPLVIGNAARPRSLNNFDTNQYVDYTNSKKSWMTSSIFNVYLESLNAKMKVKGRKILLLVDNCPAHKVTTLLSNVKVVFLPPNTTGVLQPLDLGIIRSFKCKFRKNLIRRVIHMIDACEEMTTIEAYKNITLKDAILFSYFAWEEVEAITIKNCFNKSPLFNINNQIESLASICDKDFKEIGDLVCKLKFEHEINVKDIVDITEEEVIVCDINDDVIFDMLRNKESELSFYDEEEVSDEVEAHDLSKTEIKNLLASMNNAYETLKNDKNVTKQVLNSIEKVKSYLYKEDLKHNQCGDLKRWFTKK